MVHVHAHYYNCCDDLWMSAHDHHEQVQPVNDALQSHIHHDHEWHLQHLELLQTQQMHNLEALVESSSQFEL